MTRLLQIFNCYREPGGEETFVRQLQEIIGPEQMRTVFFHSNDWVKPGAPPKWKQAQLTFSNPVSVARVMEAHREFRPDAWVFGNLLPVGSLTLYRLAAEQKVPVIHFAHNFRPFSVNGTLWANGKLCDAGLRKNFLPELLKKSWRNSYAQTALLAAAMWKLHRSGWLNSIDAWITVSSFMREKFVEAGLDPKRVYHLHPFWFAAATPPQTPEEDFYFFVGRLVSEKGIETMLEAWRFLRQRLGARAPRLIVAGRGPLSALVEQAARENLLVHYEGFVTDERKLQLIASCRAMLAPSVWWEPLGAVTYEAFNSAKPMLAARSGGLTETIEHGKTGLLHQPGNAAELANQVAELDADASRRHAMGSAGREWLLRNTNPAAFKNRLFQIVDEVLKARS